MYKYKEKIYNIIGTLFYFFRQVVYYLNPSNGYFLVGNLEVFYFLAPSYIILKIKQKKNIKKTTLIFLITCVGYLMLQILILKNLNIVRAIINLGKIIVCYFVMMWIKEYYAKIDLKMICKVFSGLCVIFLVLSICFCNGILWRHNDYVNGYDLNRLQFLYTEPSELGFHTILIILLYIFMIIKSSKVKTMFKYICYALPLIIVLFWARPLGAIGIGMVSIVVLCLLDLILNFSKKKLGVYFALLVIFIVIVLCMVYNENSLYLRIVDTINGKDTSNNYRIMVPTKVCTQIIYDTRGIGIGFGNAELEENVKKYANLGLAREGIINSYFNLVSESGIFGIIIIGTIIFNLFKKSFKEKSTIKIALSTFMGTYFTNPLCWIVYGIVLSDMDFKQLIESKTSTKIEMGKV